MARLPHPLSPPAAPAALLGAALWTFAALPCAARAEGATGALRDVPAPAAEQPVDPSPLPPIELPRERKPSPRAEEPPPPEAPPPEVTPEAAGAPAAAATPETAPAPATKESFRWPPSNPEDKRLRGCLHATVGAFTSDAGGGIAADAGLRVLSLSFRWAFRYTLEEDANVYSNSLRVAWHRGLGSGFAAYVGAGAGKVTREIQDLWTGEWVVSARSTVAVAETGLLFEYGPMLLIGLGLEGYAPLEGGMNGAPTVLLIVSINPLVLLGK